MMSSIVENLKRMRMTGNCTLEEYLYEAVSSRGLTAEQSTQYQKGDIILTKYYSPKSRMVVAGGHRIVVITSEENDPAYGGYRYKGFAMSSNITHSNKKGKYPDSLYIDDYNTILEYGEKSAKSEVMIVCSELIKATSFDNNKYGTVKIGHVKDEFLDMIETAYRNRNTGKNKSLYWEDNRATTGEEESEEGIPSSTTNYNNVSEED